MRCLVTGATGFLGSHLLQALRADGHEVQCLVRRNAPSVTDAGATAIRGDVLDPEAVSRATEGCEVVFHLAGRVQHTGEPTGLYDVHIGGTRNVVEAAAAHGVRRVVHMSTSGTVAVSTADTIACDSAPYALETVRNWPYYLSKIYAEKVAFEAHRKGKVEVIVISPSLLLGPNDDRLSSSKVLVRFLKKEVGGIPPGGLNLVDVRDAAAATLAAATRGEAGTRYLLGGPNMTLDAFFVLLQRVSGVSAPTLKVPSAANSLTARILGAVEDWADTDADEGVAYAMAGHYWYLDSRRATADLGFDARPPEQTLRDAVEWLRSRGPLPRTGALFGTAVHGVRRLLGGRR